jgi:hypothetical protein
MDKSKTRAEKPSPFRLPPSAFPLPPFAKAPKPNREQFAPKNLVFPEKFAVPLPKNTEKPRNQLVKPEGKIPRSSKNA